MLFKPPAVIFFRLKGKDPLFVGRMLQELIASERIEIKNAFTVIDENSIRQRFYNK